MTQTIERYPLAEKIADSLDLNAVTSPLEAGDFCLAGKWRRAFGSAFRAACGYSPGDDDFEVAYDTLEARVDNLRFRCGYTR